MPTHAEKKVLPYSEEQLFELVADVRRYPEFLPWCVGARIVSRTENELIADLTIGFKMFRETFRSQVTLDRPHHVHVRYLTGPFRYLNNHWRFNPIPNEGRGEATELDFFVDFEFKSRLLQAVIGTVFNEAVRLMVRAFERRAYALYRRSPAPAAAPASPAPTT